MPRRHGSIGPSPDSSGNATRLGWWVSRTYVGFAAVLVPWAVYLAVSLPRRSISEHYRRTWVGFDLALIVMLARVGWLAYRRDTRVVLAAMAGATLLVTDAWFATSLPPRRAPHTPKPCSRRSFLSSPLLW